MPKRSFYLTSRKELSVGRGRLNVSGFSGLAWFDLENTFATATFGSIIVREALIYSLKNRESSVAIVWVRGCERATCTGSIDCAKWLTKDHAVSRNEPIQSVTLVNPQALLTGGAWKCGCVFLNRLGRVSFVYRFPR